MCIGFSLFKLCRRRLSRLYLYEWRQEKTPQFHLGTKIFQSIQDRLFVLDIELRFFFDSLYTKASGTALTRLGVIFRIATMSLVVLSTVFLTNPATELHKQAVIVKEAPIITYLLLVAAITIEAYQLVRIVLSDWARVWLACMYIRWTR